MKIFTNEITKEDFSKLVAKIKETFSRHKNRIDALEKRVAYLEQNMDSPWKMPFD